MAKWIVIILTALGLVVGAVYFLEDRFVDEEEAAISLEQQRSYTDTAQQKTELEILDIYKENRNEVERDLEQNPDDTRLKLKKEKIDEKIKKLEEKLY